MPTYEFRCPDGTIIERFFRISEVPDTIPLPEGTGVATRIISGGGGLIFKGSGFYITDYGKDGKKDQRSAAGKGSTGSGDRGGPDSTARSEQSSGEPSAASTGGSEPTSGSTPASPPASSSGPSTPGAGSE